MIPDDKLQEVQTYVRERAGQRLAGERELAAQFGISRPRVRAILGVLEREGAVQRRQGSGTYALAPDAAKLGRVVVLLDASLKLGDDPFMSRLVERLQNALQESGAQCVIERTSGKAGPFRGCDGILALGAAALKTLSTAVSAASPAVGFFASATARPGSHLSLLELDDEDAGRKAVRRLRECRVERVYFCGRRDLSVVKERLAGVEAELEGAMPLELLECGLNYAAGLRLGMEFCPPPDGDIGMIAANDWLAVGLHTGLQNAGVELRRRIKLVSFDGLPLTAQPELGIESLAVPLGVMADDALAELHRLKRHGSVGRAVRYALEWSG